MTDTSLSLDRIVMTIKDAFIMMDPKGRVAFWNRNAEAMFGWSSEDVLGRDLHGLIAPERYHEAFRKGFDAFVRHGTGPAVNKVLDLFAIHRNGHEFSIELTLGAVRIADQWYAVGMIRDLALKKQLEFQLLHAERLEALGTLAGGFAHEFNNILASIMGYAELALDDAPKNTLLYSNLTEVLTAGNRAKDLIRQVLKFSRQSGALSEALHMKTQVLATMKMVRASLPDAIDIRLDLQSEELIYADPARIHQMILHLCTNAGQAMPDGGTLTVALEDVTDPNALPPSRRAAPFSPHIRLTVRDTGRGMSTDVLSRAFTPFFTTRDQGDGVGMGLPMVHGIVSGLSGWIHPESEPGKGSSFEIFLPCMEKTEGKPVIVTTTLAHGEGHILFVDDETPILKLGSHLLERMGYRVEAVSSPLAALERFRADPDAFHLVLTDMNMPDLNGLDLAAQMLRIRPDIPIVLCTGYGIDLSDRNVAQSGIRAIVNKPILADEIAETIGRLLTT
ncbi:hypothetical protein JCM14469_01140 [Desulfatiferula olefinivorans]